MTAEQVSAGRRLAAIGAVLALGAGALLALAPTRAPAASHTSAATPAASPTVTAPPYHHAAARTARMLNVDDTGHLHLLTASGSILQEEGPASGTLNGIVKVRLVVRAIVTASFTITPSAGGSIGGHGSATLHSSLRYASFGGSLTVDHGTGRYAHAHGSGRLYGVINRRTHAVTVQTVGQLNY